jgi:microcystin-dependent protein
MESYLGEIKLFAGNYAPLGWAICNGTSLSIAENTALFSLLGTTYGGDGQVTFNLPDLRSRIPVSVGQGAGLSLYNLGETAGVESVTLLTANLPGHSHQLLASTSDGSVSTPNNNFLAAPVDAAGVVPLVQYMPSTAQNFATAILNQQSSSLIGGNQPHDNIMPYLGMNYIIATEGIYPSRQ